MANVNKQLIVGRLGADPLTRETKSGTPMCMFSVAVNEKEGDGREHTEWFSVVCFGQLAFDCGNYLKKGRQVFVEGRTRTRKWSDENGIEHTQTGVVADLVQFLDEKKVIAA